MSQRPGSISDGGGQRIWGCFSEALSKFLLGPVAIRDDVNLSTVRKYRPPAPSEEISGTRHVPPPHKDPSIPVIPFLSSTKATGDSKKRQSVTRLFSSKASTDVAGSEPTSAFATSGLASARPETQPLVNESRAFEDAELELKVLDCLTDEILTSCGSANQEDIDALLLIIEEGISRPAKYQIPVSAKHSNFSLVCIRKIYVLCSRGTDEHEVRNHVAKCALPRFLKWCHHMICNFSEESQYTPLGDKHGERPKMEELICVLEVLATMTLSSDVVDSIMPKGGPMTEYVRLMRQRPDVARRGKERTHLLFLYDALCSLITCRESRIRDMVRDVMQLAGADLGFSLHVSSIDTRVR